MIKIFTGHSKTYEYDFSNLSLDGTFKLTVKDKSSSIFKIDFCKPFYGGTQIIDKLQAIKLKHLSIDEFCFIQDHSYAFMSLIFDRFYDNKLSSISMIENRSGSKLFIYRTFGRTFE